MAEESAIDIFSKLPKRSLVYALICAGGILCFILGGILPNQRIIAGLDQAKSSVASKLHQQEILFPVFRKATKTLQEKDVNALSVPEKSSLAKKDMSSMSSYFRGLASGCGLYFESGIPDAGRINDTPGVVPFLLVIKGDYFDFRVFLTRLLMVPFLEHIETIQVNTGPGMKEYRLKIHLLTDTGAVNT